MRQTPPFSYTLPLLRKGAEAAESIESVLFIGNQFSNLYTAVDTPAEAAWFRVVRGLHQQQLEPPGLHEEFNHFTIRMIRSDVEEVESTVRR